MIAKQVRILSLPIFLFHCTGGTDDLTTLSIDFETRSTVALPDTGVYVYAEHPTTDIWCMAWAFDGEEPAIWTPGIAVHHSLYCECGDGDPDCRCTMHELPERVQAHILEGGAMRAHNAQFERIMWREVMVKKYGAPEIRDEQWYCSAAEAAAMSLPRSLGQLAQALGTGIEKDDEGANLMMRMCRPRKVNDDGSLVWWDVEDRKQRLYEYCKQDVRTEQAISKCLRRLDPAERDIYLLDQRINDRGVRVDRELVAAAREVADEGIRRANGHIADLTGGGVLTVTNHGNLKKWLNENGVETESTDKAHVAELLDDPTLPETVRRVLQLRADAGRTSIAKLDSMLLCASEIDDRARGMLLYHGASTGRWSGRLVQPQNFPRGSVDNVEALIPFVLARSYDALNMVAHPLAVVSSMLRSMLVAAPGFDLMAADYSAIEAKVLNWLANQADVVDRFRRKIDQYKHNATTLFKVEYSAVTKDMRQTGKFQELGCGYGMGAKKAVAAGKATYGLTLTEDEAKAVVDAYRMTHPRVVDFWYWTERACIAAVKTPGVPVVFGGHGNLKVFVAGKYMYIALPSKRVLVYPSPRIVEGLTPWGEMKEQVEVSAVDSFSRQWGRTRLYGGLLVENIVQAVSRDIMAEAMLRAEQAGYFPILSVHDEVVVEIPKGFGSVEEFESILSVPPAWASDCPISAEGWRGERYRK